MSDIDLISQKLDAYIEKNELYHKERDEESKSMAIKVDEIHQLLTAGSLIGKVVLWIAGLITTVGAAYLMIKQIFFHN